MALIERNPGRRDPGGPSGPERPIGRERLVLRNYDDRSTTLLVKLVDARGETAFERRFTVGPLETVTVETDLGRGVYRVVARVEPGERDATDCLIGGEPTETALVETGNGMVSVVEAPF